MDQNSSKFIKMTGGMLAALCMASFAAGVAPAMAEDEAVADPAADPAADTYELLNLFGEVFERVREDYVEEVSDQKLIEAAINGMLTDLDPHSSFMNSKSFQEMQVQTKGEFGGLGIEVTMENGLVKVVSPIDDTPAYRAGIQAGDLISYIDGEQVMGLTLSEAVERMRGPVNTKIVITVLRDGEKEPLEVTIVRDVIRIHTVRSHMEGDDIGYVRITSFSEQTYTKLEEEIRKMRQEHKNLKGMVLDLRNNPGGLLDQAVSVADAFLEQGEVVSTRGRDPENARRYSAQAGDLTSGLPIVVLINGGSASASEIVAGALQDHHRAVVIGTRSFGKGSVQTVIPLDGHGAMRLTTSRYYTPSGREIQAKGIEPDITVEQAKIEPLEKEGRFEEDLRGSLKNGQEKGRGSGAAESGKDQGAENQDATKPLDDFQLARALDLLRGLAIYKNIVVEK